MSSINLNAKTLVSKIDLFDSKGVISMGKIVENGSYETMKDLSDNIIDLGINQIEKKEGFQTSKGIENMELGYDVAKAGYSGIKVAEAAYIAGAGAGGLISLGFFGALALAGGVAGLGIGIAFLAKEIDDYFSQKPDNIINQFDFEITNSSVNDKASNKSIFQSERDDWFKDFQERMSDLKNELSSGSHNDSDNHGDGIQGETNNTETSDDNEVEVDPNAQDSIGRDLGKLSVTSINDKVNFLRR